MKRDVWLQIYAPQGEALRIRVNNVLSVLDEKPERKTGMNMKRAMVIALACMLAVVGVGASGMFAPEYDAVRLANKALAETYGITDEMQTYFKREAHEENGVTTIRYNGLSDMEHVLGSYTVVIRDGKVDVSWSLDGVSTEGELDAHAWGAQQIEILLDMAKEEMGFARGYKKALELKKENEEIEVTISYEDGEGQKQTEQIQLPADSTVITVSEAAALEIARQAFAQEYALTGAQLDQMEYNKDYAGYTCTVRDGKAVYELYFWLHQVEEVYHTEGDGIYRAIVDAQTGEVIDLLYDSALAGNG